MTFHSSNATSFISKSALAKEALDRFFKNYRQRVGRKGCTVVKHMLEMQDEEDTKRFINKVPIMK